MVGEKVSRVIVEGRRSQDDVKMCPNDESKQFC